MSKKPTRYIDLSRESDVTIVVDFHGRVVGLTPERVRELLELEESILKAATGRAVAPAPAADAAPAAKPPKDVLAENWDDLEVVTHAVLSLRIKKIHAYSEKTETLRPNAVLLLTDVLAKFDWHVPAHPNTRLDMHLRAIASWGTTPGTLKDEIDRFLSRYLALRVRTA